MRRRIDDLVAQGRAPTISAITRFELWAGVFHGRRRPEQAADLADLGRALPVLPFDEDDARTAGELRAFLARGGTPIGPYDLLIGAQALRRDLTLATGNVREFSRIAGLKLEDWLA